MTPFLEELRIQRWDDHRLYHQSRVNQSLHLLSACTFLVVYVLMWFRPAEAAVLGWVVAMWVRQTGHFFFEPRGFDTVNNMDFQTKEAIKVGFNLSRKVVLLAVWLAIPVFFYVDSTALGLFEPAATSRILLDRIGWSWIGLAFSGLCARTFWLIATRNVQTGTVWFIKILTDPFNDIKWYWKSPYYLLKGQLLDPMNHVVHLEEHEGAHGTPAS